MDHRYPVNLTADRPHAFDAFPSIQCAPNGRVWVAWVSFEHRKDSICLRYFEPTANVDNLSPTWVVSTQPGENFFPTIAILPTGEVAVVWAARRNGRWGVLARRMSGGALGEEHILSGDHEGWYPTCTIDSDGWLWLAWIDRATGQVTVCKWDGRTQSKPQRVSESGHCCRPALLSLEDGVVVAWDEYGDNRYQIHACHVQADGTLGHPQEVSRGAEWQLQPQLGKTQNGGPLCCWIAQTDVRDRRGMIDQWHSIRCARLKGDEWEPLGGDEFGTVAHLVHGLLAKEQIWGYLGRRRYPFLRQDALGTPWLLWERKIRPEGSAESGHLLGRALTAEGWSQVVEVTGDFVFYEVENRQPSENGILWSAMRLPAQRPAWDIYISPIRLTGHRDHPEVKIDEWSGWEHITLPRALAKQSAKPTMLIDGVEYHVFFGDPHAHSFLSGDAEGEVDELFRYSRDKAALDFVAVVDNDCYQIPITASQFAISLNWAERFNKPGRFVTFPGYEWTLWDRERSDHPDHRTVLFPNRAGIFRHIDKGTPTTSEMAHQIEKLEGVLFSQHRNWTLTDSPAECGLEVCSAWDYYIDRPEPFHRDLRSGRRLAFIGGSDSHRRNPGTCGALTGVWAYALSREAFFEALRKRRCFATSGSKMIVDFRINGVPMGSETVATGVVELVVRAWGTRQLEKLTIVRGKVGEDAPEPIAVREAPLSGLHAEVAWHDEPSTGTWFYYVIIKQVGEDIRYPSNICIAEGSRAWTSPIWVIRR